MHNSNVPFSLIFWASENNVFMTDLNGKCYSSEHIMLSR